MNINLKQNAIKHELKGFITTKSLIELFEKQNNVKIEGQIISLSCSVSSWKSDDEKDNAEIEIVSIKEDRLKAITYKKNNI